MSTKTIALDSKVYTKLSRLKGESESFSKVIDRLVDSCRPRTALELFDFIDHELPPLSCAEARSFETTLKENRKESIGPACDLS